MIDHRDGHEENAAPGNLRWLCKSCNTRLGAEMAKQGIGRRTKQYNSKPKSAAATKGARTLQEYAEALLNHSPGAHDAGGSIIHATPKYKRQEFASEIWRRRVERYGETGRANPPAEAAEKVFEEFHGFPSDEQVIFDLLEVGHSDLAALGELVKLVILPPAGGRIDLGEFGGAILATNPERSQLYLVGGDQSVALEDFGIEQPHEREVLGEVAEVVYFTDKTHLGKQGGEAEYHHEFGEESGRRPWLLYDALNTRLEFAGGAYTIEPEGVRD